jgi:hypothetical protein
MIVVLVVDLNIDGDVNGDGYALTLRAPGSAGSTGARAVAGQRVTVPVHVAVAVKVQVHADDQD